MRLMFYHVDAHWSGASRAFATAARALASRGEEVAVVCAEGTAVERVFRQHELEVAAVRVGRSVASDAWRLRAILKDKPSDAVFVHTEREHLVVSSAMRLSRRGAIVRRIPAGAVLAGGRSGRFAERMARSRLLFSTDADRAQSGPTADTLVAPLGVDAARLENARAASRDLLGMSETTQLVVCVIDQNAGRRVTTVMRTLALLADRHPELRLVLVGRSTDADDTRMHAAALGLTSLVRFLGERDDMSAVLAAADVGWVATEGDVGGFACLDFMSARVPVIAERSPLLAQYVPDGIAGVLLPPADPSDTASTVAQFLAADAQRAAMGKAGRTRVMRDFTEEAMIDGFAAAARAATDRALSAVR